MVVPIYSTQVRFQDVSAKEFFADRQPTASYRLAVRGKDCAISLYLHPDDVTPILRGAYIRDSATYSFTVKHEHLPKWMQDAMLLLDAAGDGHKVEGVGVRLRQDLYWFPPTVDNLSDP